MLKKTLYQKYTALKDAVKEAEQIRKSVDSILRQEQRERAPRRTQKRDLLKRNSGGYLSAAVALKR